MKNLSGNVDLASENGKYALPRHDTPSAHGQKSVEHEVVHLLSHADAQNRNLSAEVSYGITTDSRISIGVTRTRTDHKLGGFLFNELSQRDLVIAVH